MEKQTPILEIQNLTVAYQGKVPILQGLSLSLETGTCLAIMGQNGAGKSSLFKAIMGILPKQAGTVFLFGKNVTSKRDFELVRLGISYMVQGGLVSPRLTVHEHLEVATMYQPRTRQQQSIEKAYDALPRLAALQKKTAGNCSGGERQLLSLGVLVAQASPLWLLDEPMAGLDAEKVAEALAFLQNWQKNERQSLIIIEHQRANVLALTNKIGYLNDKCLNIISHV